MTGLGVLIALMGAGLKIDRVFKWRDWAVTWRLLAITMPLGILAITLLVAWGIGLPWAFALLVAASLAPTCSIAASATAAMAASASRMPWALPNC